MKCFVCGKEVEKNVKVSVDWREAEVCCMSKGQDVFYLCREHFLMAYVCGKLMGELDGIYVVEPDWSGKAEEGE